MIETATTQRMRDEGKTIAHGIKHLVEVLAESSSERCTLDELHRMSDEQVKSEGSVRVIPADTSKTSAHSQPLTNLCRLEPATFSAFAR
jgi:hypothetical protein